MPYFGGVCWFESMSSLQTLILSWYSSAISSSIGAIILQGPAPFGPVVDKHRAIRLQHVSIERIIADVVNVVAHHGLLIGLRRSVPPCCSKASSRRSGLSRDLAISQTEPT